MPWRMHVRYSIIIFQEERLLRFSWPTLKEEDQSDLKICLIQQAYFGALITTGMMDMSLELNAVTCGWVCQVKGSDEYCQVILQ